MGQGCEVPHLPAKGDGNCCDGGPGHAYLFIGDQDALVLGVCWKPGDGTAR